jgi:hypothetical protein
MDLRPGTRIEICGMDAFPGFPGVAPEQAVIVRWTKRQGPRERVPGYHHVKFADGGFLLVHEDSFRVMESA